MLAYQKECGEQYCSYRGRNTKFCRAQQCALKAALSPLSLKPFLGKGEQSRGDGNISDSKGERQGQLESILKCLSPAPVKLSAVPHSYATGWECASSQGCSHSNCVMLELSQ